LERGKKEETVIYSITTCCLVQEFCIGSELLLKLMDVKGRGKLI
jgi:hypothetical protein